jgi:hypothetical protein
MRIVQRIATMILLAAVLSACAAGGRPGENEAAGQCRAQAITDTTAVPGPAAEAARDRLFKSCMAARGF